jgi:cytochrome c553
MVAFLRRLPALDVNAYRRLVLGDVQSEDSGESASKPAPAHVRTLCSRCHGTAGTGRGGGAVPSIAGQRSDYLYASLQAFRERRRFSAIMSVVAATLSDDAMRGLATYYERLPARVSGQPGDEGAVRQGAMIAGNGIPERDVPACAECHGPTTLPKNPAYPQLMGQYSDYLRLQLTLLQERRRGGTPNVNLMHAFVSRLQSSDIRAAAEYYASLPAAGQLQAPSP